MSYLRERRTTLVLAASLALAAGALIGRTGPGAQAQESDAAAIAPGLDAIEPGAEAPDSAFGTKVGRFIYDPLWRNRISAQCNILGVLRDCSGGLIMAVGTDQPDWSGWTGLNNKWVRAFGDITTLPSQCGVHLYVFNPAENIKVVTDPCPFGIVTATPTASAGGGGSAPRTCTGSTVTSVYNIRQGGDDVVWSPQRGLERSGSMLSLGGNQLFDPIVGLRFTGVALSRNAKVFSARVKFSPAASSGIAVDERIFGVNLGNLSSWGSVTPGNAPRTAANVEWQIRDQWSGSQGCGVITTSNFPGPLQNIVDRPDWNTGNALGIIFEWEGPFAEASQRPVWSFEHGCPPQLTVTWCPATLNASATSTPQPGIGPTATKPPSLVTTATPRPTPTGTPGGSQSTPTNTLVPNEKTPSPTSTATGPSATPTAATGPSATPTAASIVSATPTAAGATPTSTTVISVPSVTPTPCDNPYDLNNDGVIDIHDIDIILAAFGSSSGSPNWNPDADVNGDGRVDILDYLIVRENFGPACPGKVPTATPAGN